MESRNGLPMQDYANVYIDEDKKIKVRLTVDYDKLTIKEEYINEDKQLREFIHSGAKNIQELEVDLEFIKGAYWNDYVEYTEMEVIELNKELDKKKKGIININRTDLNYYNRLLIDIDFDIANGYANDEKQEKEMQELIEDLEARQYDYIGVGSVNFGNNKIITFDIASGSSSYYDNVIMWEDEYRVDKECRRREYKVFDCNYEIGNTFKWYDEKEDIYYIVEWNIIENK